MAASGIYNRREGGDAVAVAAATMWRAVKGARETGAISDFN